MDDNDLDRYIGFVKLVDEYGIVKVVLAYQYLKELEEEKKNKKDVN